MIDMDVHLEVSCDMIATEFRVFIVKNSVKIEITQALSETQLKHLKLRYDVKRELEFLFD